MLPRLRATLKYLSEASPIADWRITRGTCPLCDGRYFVSLSRSAFHTRCLGCRANIVNLSIVAVLAKMDLADLSGHELSSYGATFQYLRDHCSTFTFSEYFPGGPSVVDGIRNEDVTALTFKSESLDIITSNCVMEHVPEDVQGYRECWRVLKLGGMLIFTVPLYDTPSTVKLASMVNGKIEWHQTPEYHDSRLSGPRSVPAFWRHSCRDITERVRQAGFSRVDSVEVILSSAQGDATKVIVAVK